MVHLTRIAAWKSSRMGDWIASLGTSWTSTLHLLDLNFDLMAKIFLTIGDQACGAGRRRIGLAVSSIVFGFIASALPRCARPYHVLSLCTFCILWGCEVYSPSQSIVNLYHYLHANTHSRLHTCLCYSRGGFTWATSHISEEKNYPLSRTSAKISRLAIEFDA